MAIDKCLQIKVFYDESHNKCEAIFTEEQAISTYCSLMALMEENLGETYKVSQETTVYYCDDEGSWVQLKPFNDVAVIEMIRCAREVPGTDFKRIKVDDVELIMELVLAVSLEIHFQFLSQFSTTLKQWILTL